MQDDPLSQLRDVHLPEAPGWWPPAPGWWIVGLLAGLATYWLVRAALAAYIARAPRRAALAELSALGAAWQAGRVSAHLYLDNANAILKRLFFRVLGDQQASQLQGDAWLHYLDTRTGEVQYSNGIGEVLGNARFAATAPAIDEQLPALLQRTIRAAPLPPHSSVPNWLRQSLQRWRA